MSRRQLRRPGFGLVAKFGIGLLALTAIANATFAYGVAPTTAVMGGSGLPVQLTSYDTPAVGNSAADLLQSASTSLAASGYANPLSGMPPLGAVNLNFTVPDLGKFDIYDTGGIMPTDYGYGLSFTGDGVSFTGESQGTSAGLASTVSLQTALGGFSNTESYGTNYSGLACVICNDFQITGSSGADLITAKTDVFTNGLFQFDLTTPFGTFDFPSGGVTWSGAASVLADSLTAVSTLGSDHASSLAEFLANLVP